MSECRAHLQGEVVLQAGGDVQQRSRGLPRAEHQLYVPGDGNTRRRHHVVPLQQAAAQEALRTGHDCGHTRGSDISDLTEL